MNENGLYMHISDMQNALSLVTSVILSLGRHCSRPLFSNVFKNNITSSIMHISVCLLKTE